MSSLPAASAASSGGIVPAGDRDKGADAVLAVAGCAGAALEYSVVPGCLISGVPEAGDCVASVPDPAVAADVLWLPVPGAGVVGDVPGSIAAFAAGDC